MPYDIDRCPGCGSGELDIRPALLFRWAKAQRDRILWGKYYLPAIVLLAALACVIVAARRTRRA